MKKFFLSLALLLAFTSVGLGQGSGPITVKEVDGSPVCNSCRTFVFPNGSLTVSGNKVTVASGGGAAVADNTGTIGLTRVNGVAATAMRSDGAPALDQGIAPTWTGAHAFSNTITQTSASATAFQSGPNGGTNPVFRLVNSTASAATGLSITGLAAGNGVTLTALSSGVSERITLIPKTSANLGVVRFQTYSSTDYWQFTGGSLTYDKNAVGQSIRIIGDDGGGTSPAQIMLGANGLITFGSLNRVDAGNPDTGLVKAAAGVVRVANAASIGSVTSGGTFSSVAITPSQITSDQNNYSPTVGWFQRWSSDASRNITGLVAGVDGQIIEIWNVGAQNIVIQNQNASSTAANRFLTSTGADLTLAADKCAKARYDSTTSRWRIHLCN